MCSPLGQCALCFPRVINFDTRDSQAAEDASDRDKLIHCFDYIESFFQRLEIYTSVTPTAAMTDVIVKIMVEVLSILAIATKDAKIGRLSEWMPLIFTILNWHTIQTRILRSFLETQTLRMVWEGWTN